MFLKYFRSNNLSLFFVIPFIIILVWLPSLTSPFDLSNGNLSSGIFGRFFLSFASNYPVLSDIMAMAIIAVNGFLLVELNTRHFFIPGRGLIPALIYSLLSSAVPSLSILTPALTASIFFILFLYRVLGTFRQEGLSYNYFDAGILLSLTSFFYLPAILFYPLLIISLIILRPYVWREWAFAIAGLTVPYIFLFAFFYIGDVDLSLPVNNAKEALQLNGKSIMGPWLLIFLSYMAILILIASGYMFRIIGGLKVHSRKFFIIFLLIFIISILTYLLIPAAGAEIAYFMAIPVTFLISNYFMQCRQKWTNNLLLILFILAVFVLKYI